MSLLFPQSVSLQVLKQKGPNVSMYEFQNYFLKKTKCQCKVSSCPKTRILEHNNSSVQLVDSEGL